MKAILTSRIKDGQIEFLVQWEGFPGEDTWEPQKHLANNTVLKEYLAAQPLS